MRLRQRVQRLERAAGARACPACQERRGHSVLVTSRQGIDGTILREAPPPIPCDVCGEFPENVIEVVEAVVASRADLAWLAAELGPPPE